MPQEITHLAKAVCGTCHGHDGNSELPTTPKLAGLSASYIAKQLREFTAGTRTHDLVSPLIAKLESEQISDLASYFSAQTAKPGIPGDPELTAIGARLYVEGNPEAGLPSCDGCHAPDGWGSARFPRLAGQHASYLYKQLNDIKHGRRNSSPLMRAVAERLVETEMRALSIYLAGR